MPESELCWRHVIISTAWSWLPGDPRGFRTDRHKLHSSGDYKAPPPGGEHAGLHEYSKRISRSAIILTADLRAEAGEAIVAKLKKLGHRVLAVAVSATHAHLQVELFTDLGKTRRVVGQCKAVSSHALREKLPGKVWAHNGKYKKINDAEHQRRTYRYILDQKDAWTWSFKQENES